MKALLYVCALPGLFLAWAGDPCTNAPQDQPNSVQALGRSGLQPAVCLAGASLVGSRCCALAAVCAPSDYFPLQVGNLWIYQGGGSYAGTTLRLEITETGVFNGKTYFLLTGFPAGSYWLRTDDTGSVFAYDPASAAEQVWWAFQAPLGKPYATSLPNVCCGSAEIASRSFPYQGPVGNYSGALEILYPGVFQVGIESEIFLPDIGLASRTQATGGPSSGSYALTYARVNGATISGTGELSFTLALDNSAYVEYPPLPSGVAWTPPVANVRITLRNTAQPITLGIVCGVPFELVIKNSSGDTVYPTPSAVCNVMENVTLGPGEINRLFQVPLVGPDKNPLPRGRYVAQGSLMGDSSFSASAGFDIR